jgi:hypothetical protein
MVPAIGAAALSPLFVLPPDLAGLDPGDPGLAEIKLLAETHVHLLPYYLSLLAQNAGRGNPVIFPPALLQPGLADWFEIDDQIMIGEGLMAALPPPPGKGERRVQFPPGRWLHLESLAVISSPEAAVPGPSGRPLLFLREGSLLPLFPDAADTPFPAAAPHIRTGSLGREIAFTALFGMDADLTLFDHAAVSLRHAADTLVLRVRGGTPRPYSLRLMDCPAPVSASLTGGPGEVFFKYLDRSRVLVVGGMEGTDFQLVIVIR